MSDYSKELTGTVPEPYNIKRWYGHPKYRIIQKYKEHLTGTVADFGCNNGIACTMLSMLDDVTAVIGFDISEHALEQGRGVIVEHELSQPEKIELRQSNLLNIDCPDDYIDGAICFHTLEHIYPEDLNCVVAELSRVIKPGGHLIFSVPCKKAFSAEKTHVSFFSIELDIQYVSLKRLFANNGFEIVNIYEDAMLDNNKQLCITGIVRKRA